LRIVKRSVERLRFLVLAYLLFLVACSVPKAQFIIEEIENVVPVSLSFKNMSSDAESFQWSFGNDIYSTNEQDTVRYLHSGFYEIHLTATRGKKSSSYSQRIYLKAPEKCLVEIQTNFGLMTLELYNETPIHRDNFLKNIADGYYNDIRFHRIIRGFMAQAGDENTKTDKSSIKGVKDILLDAEIRADVFHTKGALAMARQPDSVNPHKKSSNTQFYIVQGAPVSMSSLENYEIEKNIEYPEEIKNLYKNLGGTPQLDKEYTIFGHLIDGFDVLDKIAGVSTDNSDKPLNDVIILKITEIN